MLSLTLELERDRAAPARARTMIRGLRPLLGAERTEEATLLVSELITNAVKYGSGPVQLHVEAGERAPRALHDLRRRRRRDARAAGDGRGRRRAATGCTWSTASRTSGACTHASMHVWFDLSY